MEGKDLCLIKKIFVKNGLSFVAVGREGWFAEHDTGDSFK